MFTRGYLVLSHSNPHKDAGMMPECCLPESCLASKPSWLDMSGIFSGKQIEA